MPLCVKPSISAFGGPPSYFSLSLLPLALIPQAPEQPVCVFLPLPPPSPPPPPHPPSLPPTCPNHHYTSFGHLISRHNSFGPLENANQFAAVLKEKKDISENDEALGRCRHGSTYLLESLVYRSIKIIFALK